MEADFDIATVWCKFLLDVELAKDYNGINMIDGGGLPIRNPILDTLLPTLLLIRMSAFLDEAFEQYIDRNGLVMPNRKLDFNNRIICLDNHGKLKDAARVHRVREQRNAVAHESMQKFTWEQMEQAIEVGQDELQHLGLVTTRPIFEISSHRRPAADPDPNYICTLDYVYCVRQDGVVVAEIKWQKHIGMLGAG